MFYKKHPIAAAIVLAILLNGLRVVTYASGAFAGFAIFIYLVATDPGNVSLALIGVATFVACFFALLKPLLPASQRPHR